MLKKLFRLFAGGRARPEIVFKEICQVKKLKKNDQKSR